MAVQLVPFHNAMRLGQGFNSFTQEICIDNAVVGISDPDDSHPLVPTTYIPIASDPNSVPVKAVGEKKGVDEMLANDDAAIITKYPSQVVTYSSKYVTKLSDVSNDLNVSGSLSIRYGEISGGGSGSYVNTEAFQNSDMNFLIVVHVTNQTINIKDQLQFWPVGEKPADKYTPKSLTDTYGDCFISGFQEGGIFTAMVSIRALKKSDATQIQADAHLALQVGVGSVEATGKFESAKKNLNENSEVTITVNWSGGGQLKEGNAKWDIDALQSVAARFPDLVAACPQRTHAILTKYTALRGFVQWRGAADVSPLGYEIANLYTSELLDVYMGYKLVWKDIHNLIDDFNAGKLQLVQAKAPAKQITTPETPATTPGGPNGAGEKLEPFDPNLYGLDKALQTCRALMVRIVAENDDVTRNPEYAIDKKRPVAYLRPGLFRQLLPYQQPPDGLLTHIFFGTVGYGEVDVRGAVAWAGWSAQTVKPQVIYVNKKMDFLRATANTSRIGGSLEVADVSTSGARFVQWGSYRYSNECRWVVVPKNDQGIFVDTVIFPDRTIPATTTPPTPPKMVKQMQRITFPYPYDYNPPLVVAFLHNWEAETKGPVCIAVAVENITTTSFDLVTTGLDTTTRITASWFACPSDLKGVKCGFSPDPWTASEATLAAAKPSSTFSDRLQFKDRTEFKRAPCVVVAPRMFALTAGTQNLRLDVDASSVTRYGFDWRANPWADTEMVGAAVSWIAWDRDFS
ncbi:hypothetical protein CAC42_3425 [Sphaceloma murrayae]|uniref:H-type lectin domain-containing protein n=1 Tax=Sphaceloma murrayae TaxID=2082308 RepID=A0A2K1R1C7_9PEZI|nr:hypothetical protein CAC42_3425 [Sphaceloma murrayae]